VKDFFKAATVGLAIAGSCAIAAPSHAQSSIPVTGGNISFSNSSIFVPSPGSFDLRTFIFSGINPTSFFIRTSQADIPINALFRTSLLPELNTIPGTFPGPGDTGQVLGTLNFRGFTASGEPGFYVNIPTELNFQITSIFNSFPVPFTQYQTPTRILIEQGGVVTATPLGFQSTQPRVTSVVLTQFQPFLFPPQDLAWPDGLIAPGLSFSPTAIGAGYTSTFSANIFGGKVDIPTPPGLNSSGFVSQTPSQAGDTFFNLPPIISIISPPPGFGPNRWLGYYPSGLIGTLQGMPIMPRVIAIGIFVFPGVPSGYWYDPPIADSFEFEMQPSPQPIGLGSRVFPGMTGQETSEASLFAEISGFPEGIDADDRFTVSVEGKVLGEFGPGQTLKFSDYREQLGDLLVNGEGVAKFTVSSIEPGVNAENELGFPIKLEFNTPTATFEMRARGEGLENSTASVFRMSEEVEAIVAEKWEAKQEVVAELETPAIAHHSEPEMAATTERFLEAEAPKATATEEFSLQSRSTHDSHLELKLNQPNFSVGMIRELPLSEENPEVKPEEILSSTAIETANSVD